MNVTLLHVAKQFNGIREVPGIVDNDMIKAMLRLHNTWPQNDEVPWCAAFVSFVCFVLGIEHSKSLLARHWLKFGTPIEIEQAEAGNDIVVLKRGGGDQPGADNLNAPGHVGFYIRHDENSVTVYGGNQSNSVNFTVFSRSDILGLRRLHEEAV